MTSWRSCVMDPSMPGFYSPTHISHVTGLFGVNKAKKVQKTRFLRKYDVITSWRSYVTIFFRSETCLHTISIFPESLKAIGGKTSPWEPILEATSSPLPRKLPTFLSYNSGTASPILDPKVALERQFGGLSLRFHRFFYSAQNERTTRQLLRKIRFREKTGFDFATL